MHVVLCLPYIENELIREFSETKKKRDLALRDRVLQGNYKARTSRDYYMRRC